jgi:hypothetical protein
VKSICTNTAEITLHQEGFIEIRLLKTDALLDIKEAKLQYQKVLDLTKGAQNQLILINTEKSSVQPTKKAQKFIANLENKKAEAFIVNSLPMRILIRFYAKSVVKYPVKIFKNREKAIEWLLSFKTDVS